MKVGVIGLGQIAWFIDEDPKRKQIWSHIKAYKNCGRVNEIYGCDIDMDVRETVGSKGIIPKNNIFSSYDGMLEACKPDIVSICTPTEIHYQIITDIVKYSCVKAVFCEKPLAFTTIQCNDVIRKCQEKGMVLAVNYQRRWDNLYLTIKEMIDNKRLGELKSIVAYTNTALYQNASHMIDLIIMLAGDIIKANGKFDFSFIREVSGNKDYGGIFYFETIKGIQGFLYATCNSLEKHLFEINLQFTGGRISSTNDGRYTTIYRYYDSESFIDKKELYYESDLYCKPNERMVDAINNIIDVIEGKTDKINCSGIDAYSSLHAIELMYRGNNNG